MSEDGFSLALDALLGHRHRRRGRGRPRTGPAFSFNRRDEIYCKFYRLRRSHSRTFLEANSNELFHCGRRQLKEALVYHDEEMSGAIADNAYELSFETDL